MVHAIAFHTHLGTSRAAFYEENSEKELLDSCRNPDTLIQAMNKNRISKSVVFSVPMLSHEQRNANEEVLRMVSQKDNLIPFAYLDPRLPESPRLLEELVEQGCRGLKLHPVCHGYVVSHHMCYPTIERAAALNLPVLIHTGWGEYGEIRFVEKLAKDFKDLNVFIAHMIEHKDIFAMIPKHNNVSLETSYSTHPRLIAQTVNSLGAERVVFGSDFPCSDPGFELLKVLKAPITDSQKEKILFKKAEKLLAMAI